MFIAIEGLLAGIVAVAHPIKDSTIPAITALHALGLRVIMATGDNERTAKAVAAKLGIDEVRAGVLPEDKKALIDELRAQGRKIAMAGDRVNDAPALAATDVGIAMGTGADVAMESAGITLLGGDLMGIVRARKLATATLRNIKQNLFFAFAYNAAGIPVAGGGTISTDRHPPVAHDRRGSDEPVVGVGHHQCPAVAARLAVTEAPRSWRRRAITASSLLAVAGWVIGAPRLASLWPARLAFRDLPGLFPLTNWKQRARCRPVLVCSSGWTRQHPLMPHKTPA